MAKGEKRGKVRVERVDTKCGGGEHMTVDEIKTRTIGPELNVACPECGEIHLTPEDVEEAKGKKITKTAKYKKIKDEAVVQRKP